MTKMTWRRFGIIMLAATTIHGVLTLMNIALDVTDEEKAASDPNRDADEQ